jgi:hypothetical protein
VQPERPVSGTRRRTSVDSEPCSAYTQRPQRTASDPLLLATDQKVGVRAPRHRKKGTRGEPTDANRTTLGCSAIANPLRRLRQQVPVKQGVASDLAGRKPDVPGRGRGQRPIARSCPVSEQWSPAPAARRTWCAFPPCQPAAPARGRTRRGAHEVGRQMRGSATRCEVGGPRLTIARQVTNDESISV